MAVVNVFQIALCTQLAYSLTSNNWHSLPSVGRAYFYHDGCFDWKSKQDAINVCATHDADYVAALSTQEIWDYVTQTLITSAPVTGTGGCSSWWNQKYIAIGRDNCGGPWQNGDAYDDSFLQWHSGEPDSNCAGQPGIILSYPDDTLQDNSGATDGGYFAVICEKAIAQPTSGKPTVHPTRHPTVNPTTSQDSQSTQYTTLYPTLVPSVSPVTNGPTTHNQTTSTPTFAPTTSPPTSSAPTTFVPTTSIPTTYDPTTSAPTSAPTTSIPTTYDPTTSAPTTTSTPTPAPTTSIPTTYDPTSHSPTTQSPSTLSPTEQDHEGGVDEKSTTLEATSYSQNHATKTSFLDNTTFMIGLIVGICVLVIVNIVIIFYCCCRRSKKISYKKDMEMGTLRIESISNTNTFADMVTNDNVISTEMEPIDGGMDEAGDMDDEMYKVYDKGIGNDVVTHGGITAGYTSSPTDGKGVELLQTDEPESGEDQQLEDMYVHTANAYNPTAKGSIEHNESDNEKPENMHSTKGAISVRSNIGNV